MFAGHGHCVDYAIPLARHETLAVKRMQVTVFAIPGPNQVSGGRSARLLSSRDEVVEEA